MLVVTEQVSGPAIYCAEQEHHVVRVDWVVAEMEKGDRHHFGLKDQQPNEGLDVNGWNAMREELFRIFGQSIEAAERNKLASLPAVDDSSTEGLVG
jgi:hypothetical protein